MIHVDTMADYFEHLYQPLDPNEKKGFNSLHTETYIPITDDPITHRRCCASNGKGWMGLLAESVEAIYRCSVTIFNTTIQ